MKKLLLFILGFMLMALSACQPVQNNTMENSPDSSGCSNGINSNSSNENNQTSSIVNLYANIEDASFAQLNVISISDKIYCFPERTEAKYLLLECSVEKDFYDKIGNGSTVFLPISLNITKNSYYEQQVISDFFEELDHIVVYFVKEQRYNEMINIDTNEIITFPYLSSPIGLALLDVIPIYNNQVSFTKLSFLLDTYHISLLQYEHLEEYTNYINEGMAIEEISQNLTNLANLTK